MENLKVKLAATLDIDNETRQKIANFNTALEQLPRELNINISLNGLDSNPILKFNLADLIIDQVEKHFNQK
jgi:hypothetical protein